MTRIVDMHSHILPGLDDGAADIKESLQMLQQAWRQGITEVVATPHYSYRYQNICPDRIRSLCGEVQQYAQKKLHIDIHIIPGQEILYSEESIKLLEEGKLLSIGGGRHVLIEFLPNASYAYIFRAVKNLICSGYYPILAHAERYQAVRESGRLEELKAQGALVQLNFRSAGRKWYHETTRWCRRMLREEMVDFLGTDMHNIKERGPDTEGTVAWMKKSLSEGYMEKALYGNGFEIVQACARACK